MTRTFTANEIKIRVVPDGKQQCKAMITYRRSALAPEGMTRSPNWMRAGQKQQRIHLQMAINEALAKGGIHD
jgi:hypothetical protein